MPDDDVVLSQDEADTANRIRALDAEITRIEEKTRRILELGMMGGRFPAHDAEERFDAKRDALLREREALAARLRRDISGD